VGVVFLFISLFLAVGLRNRQILPVTVCRCACDVLKEKHKPDRVARSFEKFRLEKYQVEITPDKKHGIRFKFVPENLLDYLILRLAHVVLAPPAYSPCLASNSTASDRTPSMHRR
jgi:hypothetical protein